MSLESVKAWMADHAPELRLIEAHGSTATVADAAETLCVEPGRIAKTIALKVYNDVRTLIVQCVFVIIGLQCDRRTALIESGGWCDISGCEFPLDRNDSPNIGC